jgi:hypothetical protein
LFVAIYSLDPLVMATEFWMFPNDEVYEAMQHKSEPGVVDIPEALMLDDERSAAAQIQKEERDRDFDEEPQPFNMETASMLKTRLSNACTRCKRMKVSCGHERPCRRCIRAGTADDCVDCVHKKPGRKPVGAAGADGTSMSSALALIPSRPIDAIVDLHVFIESADNDGVRDMFSELATMMSGMISSARMLIRKTDPVKFGVPASRSDLFSL